MSIESGIPSREDDSELDPERGREVAAQESAAGSRGDQTVGRKLVAQVEIDRIAEWALMIGRGQKEGWDSLDVERMRGSLERELATIGITLEDFRAGGFEEAYDSLTAMDYSSMSEISPLELKRQTLEAVGILLREKGIAIETAIASTGDPKIERKSVTKLEIDRIEEWAAMTIRAARQGWDEPEILKNKACLERELATIGITLEDFRTGGFQETYDSLKSMENGDFSLSSETSKGLRFEILEAVGILLREKGIKIEEN